ncbi:MAG: ABC transporter substrate-binding protein [Dehalococcoidia bacterium]
MLRKNGVFLSVILILVLLLFLPACAKPAPAPTLAPVPATTPTTTKPAPTPTPTPAKKLVVAIKQTGENFEILSAGTAYPDIVSVVSNVFEFYLDREPSKAGLGKVIPGLCESWTVSPDGLMMQFNLRKGVKFHSGDPLTTADIQFSYDRALKDATFKGMYKTIDHLEIVNDYTFKFYFKSPDVSFIPGLGYPVESKTYYDRVGEAEFVKHPVGTGPYKIVDFKTGEYVDLEAFADYWGGAPAIKQVRFRFASEDSTRVAMLKTGEADVITQVPYPLVSDLQKTKGLKTVGTDAGNRTAYIKFQNVNPKTFWYDIRVRQAFAMSINLQAIVNDIELGLVTCYPALSPVDIGYDPQLKHYEYNPEKAKTLLAQAGYPNGLDLTLNYMIGEYYGLKETADAVSSYLNAVGIRAKIVAWEGPKWAEYNAKAKNNPDMDYVSMGIGGIAGVPDSTSGLYNQYSSVSAYASYFNKEVNDLAVLSRATMDDNARAEILKKAWSLIRADYAYIPLYTMSRIYGMKDNLDFTPTARGVGLDIVLIKDIKIK